MHSKYQQGALGDTHGCPQNGPVRPVPKTAHRDDRQQVKQILCRTPFKRDGLFKPKGLSIYLKRILTRANLCVPLSK